MRICIYGAGAIGGMVTARLADAGNDVSVIVRGANLEAIRTRGLRFRHHEVDILTRRRATDAPAEIGPVDPVIVAAKGPALPAIGARIGALLGPDTPVVFAINGIPWWYDQGRPGAPTGIADLLDPDGALRANVGARAIGCVVDCPTRVEAPGVVVCGAHGRGKFTLGEPDGSASARMSALSATFEAAGLAAPVSDDIRTVIWAKLVINISRSPLAVLTGATELEMAKDPAMTALCRAVVEEAAAAAAAVGVTLPLDWPFLLDVAHRYDHRPSMLQDWDHGRAMEIDSIVVAVQRLAAAGGLATPALDVVAALLRCKARVAGTYAG